MSLAVASMREPAAPGAPPSASCVWMRLLTTSKGSATSQLQTPATLPPAMMAAGLSDVCPAGVSDRLMASYTAK